MLKSPLSPLLPPPKAVPDWSELYRRALSQIALQAFPDPPRVQSLAEALLSAGNDDLHQMREALAEYVQKYPHGATFCWNPWAVILTRLCNGFRRGGMVRCAAVDHPNWR